MPFASFQGVLCFASCKRILDFPLIRLLCYLLMGSMLPARAAFSLCFTLWVVPTLCLLVAIRRVDSSCCSPRGMFFVVL